jgi:ubiquitin thioesterase protein OTUB1
LLI